MDKIKFNREELEREWSELKEKCKGDFISPKDVRRMDEITSLLMTDGAQSNIQFKLLKKGNGIGKGTHNLQFGKRR